MIRVLLCLGLAGCTGEIHLGELSWPVRGAIYLEDEEDSGRTWWMITNSALNCEPEITENDPRTALDEAASAKEFWEAEVIAAITREDALVIVLALLGDDASSPEPWPIRTGSWTYEGERVMRAAWMWVEEAGVESREALISDYVILEAEGEGQVSWGQAALVDGWLELETESGPSARAKAQACDNPGLRSLIYQALLRAEDLPASESARQPRG